MIIAIAVSGIFAYRSLGRSKDPTFTVKALTVTAARPGATAEEMQNLVVDPLEKRLQELNWHDHVDTFTRPGLALTSMVFWGSLAYTLIGGTAAGTLLVLLFLPALYTIRFKVKPSKSAAGDKITVPHGTSEQAG